MSSLLLISLPNCKKTHLLTLCILCGKQKLFFLILQLVFAKILTNNCNVLCGSSSVFLFISFIISSPDDQMEEKKDGWGDMEVLLLFGDLGDTVQDNAGKGKKEAEWENVIWRLKSGKPKRYRKERGRGEKEQKEVPLWERDQFWQSNQIRKSADLSSAPSSIFYSLFPSL